MLSTCLLIASLAPADTLEARETLQPSLRVPPALRQMCIRAPAVVLARPVDPLKPTQFTVAEVLRGKGVKVGDRISAGLIQKEVESFDEPDLETKKPRPRKVVLALLFLEPAEVDGKLAPYRVQTDGYRFCTDDGRVLTPAIAQIRKG